MMRSKKKRTVASLLSRNAAPPFAPASIFSWATAAMRSDM